ncbi:hypothetical protein Tco_1000085 [Tanacetum coccineum]
MSTQQDMYVVGSETRPPMLNKENYVPCSSHLLCYATSRPNRKLIYNSIMSGPYVRRIIPEPGYPDREVPVNETFHEQIDDELTKKELKQIYAAVNSCETAQEIWLRVQQMIKDSDFGIQEKKAKLFNEWERFTSTNGESIESYYHRFLKLMNDFKRNKHFPEKIASNIKFLNNLQPEWSRHVTIVHQTKDLHTTDYTQLYDFLKYNQKEVDDLRAERLARTHDPLALMANSNNPFNYPVFHQDQPSPNISDPTTAMNTALVLIAKAFKLSTPTKNNQRTSSNPRNRQIAQPGMNMGQDRQIEIIGGNGDLDEIEEVNANCILMDNLQQALTSGTQIDKSPVYDSDGSAEVQLYDNCYNNDIFNMFTQEEQYTELSKEKSIVSSLLEEKKKLKSDFKIREDELLDKQIQLENKIKELDNILVKLEAAKFVRDFKSLANESVKSFAKHKDLEFEIERLLRVVVSQDIMSIVQNPIVVETFDLQTELEQCKYDNISYDKAYNDMQQKIERLQAQLGDLKGKSRDTPCVSNTLDPLSQKLENENVELEIHPFKTSKEDKFVPINKVRASVRTNLITVPQPHVISKKVVNSDSNGLSSTRVDITTKTRRP